MNPNTFENYQTENFFDEMFGNSKDLDIFEFYKPIYDRITGLTESEFEQKKKQADSSFLEHGVTFTVYGDDIGTERIFPLICPSCNSRQRVAKSRAGLATAYSCSQSFS